MNQAEIKRRQTESFSTILTLITLSVVSRITGVNGAMYLVAAFEIFWLLWIVIGGNVSETLGRLLRVRNSKGQYKNALKMRRSVMIFQIVMGFAGSFLILIFADRFLQVLFRMQYSTFILEVMAPVFLLRTISAVLLGFFQGEGNELPAATSAILRQVFILGFGLLFGRMLGNYGDKVSRLLLEENFTAMYGGVGIAIAINLTEVFIVIFLLLIYKGTKRSGSKVQEDGMRFTDSFFDSIRIFCMSRGVQTGIQLLAFLPCLLGLLFWQKAVDDMDTAVAECGAYLSGYVVVCGILTILIYMVLLSMTGKVFVHLRKEEQRYAKSVFQSGTHICMIHGMFATVALTVLASQVALMVSPGQADAVKKMFFGGASVILFLSLALYFCRVLVLTGRKLFVLGSLVICNVIFVITLTVFLNTKKIGIGALVYGGLIAIGVTGALMGVLAYKQLRCRFDWLQVLIIPAGVACVSGLLMMFLAKILTPHVGALVTILVSIVLGGSAFWILLIVLRNFREHETEVIPGGRIINAIGQMLHIS